MHFSIAGEGTLDLAVAEIILNRFGHEVSAAFDKRGKDNLDSRLSGYLNASRISPWLVLRDLDTDDCAPTVLNRIAPNIGQFPNMHLRICVRSVEAWLLADSQAFAQFLGVRIAAVPQDPDDLAYPKTTLVQIAAGSRRRNLRDGIVPRPQSGRAVGPEYNSIMTEFVLAHWNVERAIGQSPSLDRAVNRIRAIPVN